MGGKKDEKERIFIMFSGNYMCEFAAGAEGAFRIPNPIALGTETMRTKTAHTGLIFVRRIPGAFRNAEEGTGSEAERI